MSHKSPFLLTMAAVLDRRFQVPEAPVDSADPEGVLSRGRKCPCQGTVDRQKPRLLDFLQVEARVGSRRPAGTTFLLASLVLALLPSCRPGQPGGERVVERKLAPGDPGIEVPGGSSEDAIARADAIREAIAGQVDPGSALLSGLIDKDALVRGTTVSLLLTAKTSLVRKVLVEFRSQYGPLYGREQPVELRLLACELAARKELDDVLERRRVCRLALEDGDPLVRSRAADRCVRNGLYDSSAIERLAGDSHWAVRTRLASALGTVTDRPSACRTLRRLVHDGHATVRTAAIRASERCTQDIPEDPR